MVRNRPLDEAYARIARLLSGDAEVEMKRSSGARLIHWQAHPAAMAWTHGIIGAPRPAPDVLTPLPVREQRDEAITGLVEYLRGVGAPAVAALYEER